MVSSLPYIDLYRLLGRILRTWGAEQVQEQDFDPQLVLDLPLERAVTLTGTLQGILVVRCEPEFAAWLRALRQSSALGRYPEEEVFEELVSLFCLYLFHDLWNPDSFEIGPVHPVPSSPESWPMGAPQNACALNVEGRRLELRLWA